MGILACERKDLNVWGSAERPGDRRAGPPLSTDRSKGKRTPDGHGASLLNGQSDSNASERQRASASQPMPFASSDRAGDRYGDGKPP